MHGISVEQMRRELSRESLEMPLSGMNHGSKELTGCFRAREGGHRCAQWPLQIYFDRGEVIKSSIKMNLFSIV